MTSQLNDQLRCKDILDLIDGVINVHLTPFDIVRSSSPCYSFLLWCLLGFNNNIFSIYVTTDCLILYLYFDLCCSRSDLLSSFTKSEVKLDGERADTRDNNYQKNQQVRYLQIVN